MKKTIVILFLIIIIASLNVCLAKDYKFPDIYSYGKDRYGNQIIIEHFAVREITQATNIGMINGYPDGTFRPDEPITRAEFIKMLMVLATNRTFDFESIESNLSSWAGPYLKIAEIQGVVEPGYYTDENINAPITRLEMVKMLSKTQILMKGIPQNQVGKLAYTDISTLTDEEKELLLHAVKYDLLEGMKDGSIKKFEQNKSLTRGEAAAALMRIY